MDFKDILTILLTAQEALRYFQMITIWWGKAFPPPQKNSVTFNDICITRNIAGTGHSFPESENHKAALLFYQHQAFLLTC